MNKKPIENTDLFGDICNIIDKSRHHVAVYVNVEICQMNWSIGNRIKEDILFDRRADYGKQIMNHLSEKLTAKYGKGWGAEKLKQCVRAAYVFSEDEIMYAARTQLTWTHLRSLMAIDSSVERQFYMEMCRIEHWDTRTLDDKIEGQLYQRTFLSKKSETVIRNELSAFHHDGSVNPDLVFRSTYFLDMLGLPDVFSEKELEDSIISNILEFIKELGNDFTFVDRQKRITVDDTDYFIDLLFYHRGLRRLVAIDLKLGKFKPIYEGQMRLYLRYLNRNDRKSWEEEPIGLILCSEGNTEHIQYLMMDEKCDIRVAQYYTQLPDKSVLSDRLQRAIAIAREQHSAMKQTPNRRDCAL